MMVPTGKETGTGGGAERGGMEIAVTDPTGRKSVKVWRIDVGAVTTEVSETRIVEKDKDDIGASFRGSRGICPFRYRFAQRATDNTTEVDIA